MNLAFAGRIALITGASRGIGAALARRLGAEGAHCILCARTVKGLEETDDAIKAAGGQASLVPIDLMETARLENLAFTLARRFGRIDILVGNAARLGRISPVSHIDSRDWLETLALNVTANRELIRIFETLLRSAPAARVVFINLGCSKGKSLLRCL